MRVGRSLKAFRRPWLWSALWMLGVAAVVAGSLLPPGDLPSAPMTHDKLLHFSGYFVLMAGAVQLYARRASWVAMALLLQASVLLRAGSPIARAFCASRLGNVRGRVFGVLPAGIDSDAVLARNGAGEVQPIG